MRAARNRLGTRSPLAELDALKAYCEDELGATLDSLLNAHNEFSKRLDPTSIGVVADTADGLTRGSMSIGGIQIIVTNGVPTQNATEGSIAINVAPLRPFSIYTRIGAAWTALV